VVSSDPKCIPVAPNTALVAGGDSNSVVSGYLVALVVYAVLAVGCLGAALYLSKSPERAAKMPVAVVLSLAFVARLLVALSDSNARSFASVADILSVVPFVAYFFINSAVFGRVRSEAALPSSRISNAFTLFYGLMGIGVIALIIGAAATSSTQQNVATYALRVMGAVSLIASLLFSIHAFFTKSVQQKPDETLVRYSVVFAAGVAVESFAWLVAASAGPVVAVFLPVDLLLCFSASRLFSAKAVINRKQQPLAAAASLPPVTGVVPAGTA